MMQTENWVILTINYDQLILYRKFYVVNLTFNKNSTPYNFYFVGSFLRLNKCPVPEFPRSWGRVYNLILYP